MLALITIGVLVNVVLSAASLFLWVQRVMQAQPGIRGAYLALLAAYFCDSTLSIVLLVLLENSPVLQVLVLANIVASVTASCVFLTSAIKHDFANSKRTVKTRRSESLHERIGSLGLQDRTALAKKLIATIAEETLHDSRSSGPG